MTNINFVFKKVSPLMAEEIISKSNDVFNQLQISQRKIREASVALYASDMENGKWDEENGETIKISSDGAIIDGQHRLRAVMRCKKTIGFLFAENVPIEALKTVDIGLKRSLENTLQIFGRSYETGAGTIVRQKLTLDRNLKSFSQSDPSIKVSRISQVEEYEKNTSYYDHIAQFSKKIYKMSEQTLAVSEVGAIYAHLMLTLKKEQDIIEDFFTQLANYSNGSKTIFGTTYRTLQDKKACRGVERIEQYILCWNSFIGGRRTIRNSKSDWFE